KLWKLLVLDDSGRLLGYVRKNDIARALPSLVTSLDRHEINYLLSKLTIDKIMRTNMEVIAPEATIEEAAQKMYDEDLAGLAVVDAAGDLIGYINRSVMLSLFVEEMGMLEGGSRIVFSVVDKPGILADVSGMIADLEIGIISTGTFFHNGERMVVIRVATDDPSPVEKVITDAGYRVVGPKDFEQDWKK
ncbi:MAG: CBS domain-containing protein, partial [Desulfovibrionaceae bacterium]